MRHFWAIWILFLPSFMFLAFISVDLMLMAYAFLAILGYTAFIFKEFLE